MTVLYGPVISVAGPHSVAWTVLVGEVLYADSLHVSVTETGRDVVVIDPLVILDGEVTEEERGDVGMELLESIGAGP